MMSGAILLPEKSCDPIRKKLKMQTTLKIDKLTTPQNEQVYMEESIELSDSCRADMLLSKFACFSCRLAQFFDFCNDNFRKLGNF